MTEPSRVRPPADFWREVPCGHPPDPVAWNSPNGPVCHCGTDLDPAQGIDIPEAPGPVVLCQNCGCHVACPAPPDSGESESTRGEPRLTHGRHCPCSACALQDWSDPALAACGMHGPSCPPRYAPYHGVKLGDPAPTPTPGEDARVAELDVITVRATVIEAYDDGSATLEIGAKGEVVNLDAEQLAFTRATSPSEEGDAG